MGIKKEALLYYNCVSKAQSLSFVSQSGLHLLKLVTGVDTSTRPVSRSGSDGNATKRRMRRPAAALRSVSFRRTTDMLGSGALERRVVLFHVDV
jgi:hypothetical protein